MCFHHNIGLYLFQCNFIQQKVLKQFRIFNGWSARFLNAKFLKAVREKENLINKYAGKIAKLSQKPCMKMINIKYILLKINIIFNFHQTISKFLKIFPRVKPKSIPVRDKAGSNFCKYQHFVFLADKYISKIYYFNAIIAPSNYIPSYHCCLTFPKL
jgi:hypothetical protein